MYIIVLVFAILRSQMTVSFPFPTHMDFQKVGEVIFNNEKYNVLKPTTHVITDYFKDFMLRRDNINFPTKRVFMDHNGFRHAWTGFGEKIKSLRKTGHIHKSINENSTLIDAQTNSPINEPTKNETATAGREKQVSDGSNQEKSSTESNDLSHKYTKDNETSNKATSNNNSATEEDTSLLEDLSKKKLRDGDTKTTTAPAQTTTKEPDTTQAPKKVASGRTVAQTTFFCPFFGLITMSAFID